MDEIVPRERVPRALQGLRDVETKCIVTACGLAFCDIAGGQLAARSRVYWPFRPMGRGPGARDLVLDFLACAEAGIEQIERIQFRERSAIVVKLFTLAPDRLLPRQSQPPQVLA